MSDRDRLRWDERWQQFGRPPTPHRLLVEHRELLPGGLALDVACGLGQNTLWIAQQGYLALGVDLSRVALVRATTAAGELGVASRCAFAQIDLDHWHPAPHSVDLVCVFRFLDRDLMPALFGALRPAGLFFFETRHVGLLETEPDANPAYLLQRGELRQFFQSWQIVSHCEGAKNAAIVARKPGG